MTFSSIALNAAAKYIRMVLSARKSKLMNNKQLGDSICTINENYISNGSLGGVNHEKSLLSRDLTPHISRNPGELKVRQSWKTRGNGIVRREW